MSHTISAIIVNYNAGALLRGCVDALMACPQRIEVIVVDNASTDDSLNGMPESGRLSVLRNPANVGFAAGCNIGLKTAAAPLLLFLNPDCYFQPSAIAILLEALQSGERVGMVGGLLVNSDGSEQGGGRRAVPTPWRAFVRAFGLYRLAERWPKLFYDFHLHKKPLPDGPVEVEAISGACMLVKREALEDVGLWDEGYFLHCEDLDWCMRFQQHNWQIWFVPGARIAHALGACSHHRRLFVEWHKHKGMVRYYGKFFRDQYPAPLWWLVVLGVWLRFFTVATYTLFKQGLARLRRRDG